MIHFGSINFFWFSPLSCNQGDKWIMSTKYIRFFWLSFLDPNIIGFYTAFHLPLKSFTWTLVADGVRPSGRQVHMVKSKKKIPNLPI